MEGRMESERDPLGAGGATAFTVDGTRTWSLAGFWARPPVHFPKRGGRPKSFQVGKARLSHVGPARAAFSEQSSEVSCPCGVTGSEHIGKGKQRQTTEDDDRRQTTEDNRRRRVVFGDFAYDKIQF